MRRDIGWARYCKGHDTEKEEKKTVTAFAPARRLNSEETLKRKTGREKGNRACTAGKRKSKQRRALDDRNGDH